MNKVTLKLLRNKSGPSGYSLDILLSQRDGVLPSLTEFYFLKENDRFGIEGSDRSYWMTLFPEVKMGRTTLRENIDSNPLLRRAIKITADLLQIKQLYRNLPQIDDLNDFYNKLQDKYGWDVLLNTRDYWTFNQYEHEVPFLSTLDLIEMYYDKYVPFWWKDSMKTKKV